MSYIAGRGISIAFLENRRGPVCRASLLKLSPHHAFRTVEVWPFRLGLAYHCELWARGELKPALNSTATDVQLHKSYSTHKSICRLFAFRRTEAPCLCLCLCFDGIPARHPSRYRCRVSPSTTLPLSNAPRKKYSASLALTMRLSRPGRPKIERSRWIHDLLETKLTPHRRSAGLQCHQNVNENSGLDLRGRSIETQMAVVADMYSGSYG